MVAPIAFLFLDRSFRCSSVASLGIKVRLPMVINILMILRKISSFRRVVIEEFSEIFMVFLELTNHYPTWIIWILSSDENLH